MKYLLKIIKESKIFEMNIPSTSFSFSFSLPLATSVHITERRSSFHFPLFCLFADLLVFVFWWRAASAKVCHSIRSHNCANANFPSALRLKLLQFAQGRGNIRIWGCLPSIRAPKAALPLAFSSHPPPATWRLNPWRTQRQLPNRLDQIRIELS